MALVDEFARIMRKLPFSESRIPYTYHHDYIIANVKRYKNCSRSDIANLKCWTEDELYATALLQVLDESKTIVVLMAISKDDLTYSFIAYNIVQQYLERITKFSDEEIEIFKTILEAAKKGLAKEQDYNKSAWESYGSELCAGHMIRREREMEDEIKILEDKINGKYI